MKKWMALVLALAMVLAMPLAALAQGGAPDELPEAAAQEGEFMTQQDALAAARGASQIYALIARSFDYGTAAFYGAPNPSTAWALTYAALEQGAVEGLFEGEVAQQQLQSAYDALFAQGALGEMPEDFTLFSRDQDVYRLTSDAENVEYLPSVMGVEIANGEIIADVVVLRRGYAPADLAAHLSVSLLPDEGAPFGARLIGLMPVTGAPAMAFAEATATLAPYKDITYEAQNVLDGDFATCWAYSEAQDPGAVITLSADGLQTVRGIRLTPAYAKSGRVAMTNNRIRSIRVELSDGAVYDFVVEPDLTEPEYQNLASFVFDQPHEVVWASVRVTGVYAGEKYNDTCISEIALF